MPIDLKQVQFKIGLKNQKTKKEKKTKQKEMVLDYNQEKLMMKMNLKMMKLLMKQLKMKNKKIAMENLSRNSKAHLM